MESLCSHPSTGQLIDVCRNCRRCRRSVLRHRTYWPIRIMRVRLHRIHRSWGLLRHRISTLLRTIRRLRVGIVVLWRLLRVGIVMTIVLLMLWGRRRHLLDLLRSDGLLLMVVLNTCWWRLRCSGRLLHVVVGDVLLLLLAAKEKEDP
jgi:hypothetical protein